MSEPTKYQEQFARVKQLRAYSIVGACDAPAIAAILARLAELEKHAEFFNLKHSTAMAERILQLEAENARLRSVEAWDTAAFIKMAEFGWVWDLTGRPT